MSNKLEELMNTAKINELLHKKELEEKNKNGIIIALAIIGAVAAVAAIAYAVFRHLERDYLDDFDADDFGDNFDVTLLSSQIQHQKQRLILTTKRKNYR